MGKNQSASNLTNIIQYNNGNISFVSGSTTLMSISSSGAITVTGVISGSNAQSASYAINTSYLNNSGSGEFVPTGSFNTFSSSILTYTGSANSRFSSLETTSGSNITRIAALETASGSAITRLNAIEVVTGSNISRLNSIEAKTGSYATTGSNIFVGSQTITGSILGSGSLSINGCIVSTGQIVAQTINVQQVTSSIVYSCGSNIFGCAVTDTQQMTGSLRISGSNALFNVGCVGIGVTSSLTAKINLPSSDYGEGINLFPDVNAYNRTGIGKYMGEFRSYIPAGDFYSWYSCGPTGNEIFRLTGNTGAACYSGSLSARSLTVGVDCSGVIIDVASRHGIMKYFNYSTGFVGSCCGTDNSTSTWLGRFAGPITAPTAVYQDLTMTNSGIANFRCQVCTTSTILSSNDSSIAKSNNTGYLQLVAGVGAPSGTANFILYGCANVTNAGNAELYGDNIRFGAATAPYAIRACIGSSSNWFSCITTFSSSLRVGGATGNFLIDSYTTSKIGIRSWTDIAGTTNNFFLQNNANYNYGIVGVVSATGAATGDVYALGYSPSAGTSMTPVLNWTSDCKVGIGISSPGAKLHVYDGAAISRILVENSTSNSYALYQSSTANSSLWQLGTWNNNTYRLGISGVGDFITVESNGEVGIGTTAPQSLLHVCRGDISLELGAEGNSCKIFFSVDHNAHYIRGTGYWVDIVGNENEILRVWKGDTSIAACEVIRVTGTGITCFKATVCAPCFATISDYRMKYDVKPITNSIGLIGQMKPYSFKLNYDNQTSFGMIAHELQEVLPEAVFGVKDGETMQGVDYMKLLPITIKAIQEQQCIINTLKTCLGIA